MEDLKKKLIRNGVKNLIEFGYPNCNEQNILTDEIYSEFFISMLNENKGNRSDVDKAIDSILEDIKKSSK